MLSDMNEKHTSFFIIKKDNSLCYGLGMDMVHRDFPFSQSVKKSSKEKSRGWQTLDFAVSFLSLSGPGDKIQ
jgi:hypothetical protein